MGSDQVVAGYYRVSVARDEMRSPKLYEEEIERYSSYRNLTLGRLYSDIDYIARVTPPSSCPSCLASGGR
jgi:hypothetical protein